MVPETLFSGTSWHCKRVCDLHIAQQQCVSTTTEMCDSCRTQQLKDVHVSTLGKNVTPPPPNKHRNQKVQKHHN